MKRLTVSDLEYQLRYTVGTALVQSGYLDQDDDGDIDLTKWHECPGCPNTGGCACSGIPYLSNEVWDAMDRTGNLTELMDLINTAVGQAYNDGYWAAMTKMAEKRDINHG